MHASVSTLLIVLTILCYSLTAKTTFAATTIPSGPSKLQVYISPPKVLADNSVYEVVYVQPQDANGNPARASEDVKVLLLSSKTDVGTVQPEVTIRKGETYAVAKFSTTFVAGTTTITAMAADSGYASGTATITTVGPSKLAFYAVPPVLPVPLSSAEEREYPVIIVQLLDANDNPAKAPKGGVEVMLYSSNTTVGTVTDKVVIKEGEDFAVANATFYPTYSPGSTTIVAATSGLKSDPKETQKTITTMAIKGQSLLFMLLHRSFSQTVTLMSPL